jgi:hypothetical protein
MQEMLAELVKERDRLKQSLEDWDKEHARSARKRTKFSDQGLPEDSAWIREEETTPGRRPRGRPPKEKRDYQRKKPFLAKERENPAQGICFGCRDWREPLHPTPVTYSNGRPALLGTCPVCGAKMSRIIKAS